MTIIKHNEIQKIRIDGKPFKKIKYELILKCDNCDLIFIRTKKIFLNYKHHFCSKICHSKSLKDGVLKDYQQQLFLDKYGVKNPFQIEEVKNKIKQTNIDRYGVEFISQNKDIKEKQKQTNLKKYGYEYASQNQEVKNKIEKTNIERYGASVPAKNKDILAKMQKTSMERYGVRIPIQNSKIKEKRLCTIKKRYGVEHILQNEVILNKVQETNVKRYGFKSSFQNKIVQETSKKNNLKKYGVEQVLSLPIMHAPEIIQKVKETNIKKYGATCYLHSEEGAKKTKITNINKYGFEYPIQNESIKSKINFKLTHQKSKKTRIKNKTYTKSNLENKFHMFLCELFDSANIIRQTLINGWAIDFYIKSINKYIQFDGVYWHGLYMDISKIKELKNKQSISIINTYNKDREQDIYFKQNNLILIRITDLMFKSLSKDNIKNIILGI